MRGLAYSFNENTVVKPGDVVEVEAIQYLVYPPEDAQHECFTGRICSVEPDRLVLDCAEQYNSFIVQVLFNSIVNMRIIGKAEKIERPMWAGPENVLPM